MVGRSIVRHQIVLLPFISRNGIADKEGKGQDLAGAGIELALKLDVEGTALHLDIVTADLLQSRAGACRDIASAASAPQHLRSTIFGPRLPE